MLTAENDFVEVMRTTDTQQTVTSSMICLIKRQTQTPPRSGIISYHARFVRRMQINKAYPAVNRSRPTLRSAASYARSNGGKPQSVGYPGPVACL
jgi:hypothetical protein